MSTFRYIYTIHIFCFHRSRLTVMHVKGYDAHAYTLTFRILNHSLIHAPILTIMLTILRGRIANSNDDYNCMCQSLFRKVLLKQTSTLDCITDVRMVSMNLGIRLIPEEDAVLITPAARVICILLLCVLVLQIRHRCVQTRTANRMRKQIRYRIFAI